MNEQNEWYSYSVFRFTREQNIWTGNNYDHFFIGRWPPMPFEFITDEYCKETKKWIKVIKQRATYTDPPLTNRTMNRHAYFENPKIIIAEIESRLKRTKTDGKLLKSQLQGGVNSYELLEPEAQSALNYISLFDFRRRPPYPQWKKQHRYYVKKKFYQKVEYKRPAKLRQNIVINKSRRPANTR